MVRMRPLVISITTYTPINQILIATEYVAPLLQIINLKTSPKGAEQSMDNNQNNRQDNQNNQNNKQNQNNRQNSKQNNKNNQNQNNC
jgi:hypothetical protein